MDKIYFKPKKIIGYNKQISSPTRWSSMHWKAVSKQWRCWAIITSLSGMKEKFLMIFEAATAHCCFSARPSSSKLNRPSSSSHNSVKRDFVTPLCCVDSVPAEPDPTLHKENHPTTKFILLPPHLQKGNIQLIENWKLKIKDDIQEEQIYPGRWRALVEPNAWYSFPNPVTTELAPNVLTLVDLANSFGSAISRQSSICFKLQQNSIKY